MRQTEPCLIELVDYETVRFFFFSPVLNMLKVPNEVIIREKINGV